MDTLEDVGVEHLLQFLHRRAQHMCLARGVQAHVVTRGVDPVDRRDVEPHGLAADADRDHRRVAARRPACDRGQRVRLDLALAREVGEQRHELLALRERLALVPLTPHAVESARKPLLVDRLQKVVERACFEGVDGEAIEGGHEHDHRHAFLRHACQHVESRQSRHLDVEEHQIGRMLGYRGERLPAVRALRDDLDVLCVLQPDLEAPACELLIVHDDRANTHAVHHLYNWAARS